MSCRQLQQARGPRGLESGVALHQEKRGKAWKSLDANSSLTKKMPKRKPLPKVASYPVEKSRDMQIIVCRSSVKISRSCIQKDQQCMEKERVKDSDHFP